MPTSEVTAATTSKARSTPKLGAGLPAQIVQPDTELVTLDTGLGVLMVDLPHLHRVHAALVCGVGSRDEDPQLQGISHFLEHLMFRGTPSLPTLTQVSAAFEDVGGHLDASTSREFTVFDSYFPPEGVQAGLKLLADFICEPRLVGVSLERKIILEEMAADLDESGQRTDPEHMTRRATFPDHGLGRSIIGTAETLKRVSTRELRDHYETFYGAGNAVLAVAGPVDRNAIVDWASQSFARLHSGERPARQEPTRPDTARRASIEALSHGGTGQTELSLAFRGLREGHELFPALELLSRIVDDGLSTRLPSRMVDELGMAYAVSADLEVFTDASAWFGYAAVGHRKAARAVAEILKIFGMLTVEPPTEAELARARRRARWELSALLDSPRSLGGWLAQSHFAGQPFDLPGRVAAFEQVDRSRLLAAARAVIHEKNLALGLVGRTGPKTSESIGAAIAEHIPS